MPARAPTLTEAQHELLRESFPALARYGEDLSRLFYERLFEIAPHLRPLFKSSIREQGQRFMATLNLVISQINATPQLEPLLHELGRRHAELYGVVDADYAPVGEALLWAVSHQLGSAMTPDMRAAWAAGYALVADMMQHHKADRAA